MCSSHFERRPRGTHGRYVAAGLTAALAGWTLLLGGCEVDAPRYRFGENLGELRFSVFDPDEGIYPSQGDWLCGRQSRRILGSSRRLEDIVAIAEGHKARHCQTMLQKRRLTCARKSR